MKKDYGNLIDSIEAFDDTPELCHWIAQYRDDIASVGETAQIRYYLEEARQNLEGMNDLLQEIRKAWRNGDIVAAARDGQGGWK